MPYLPPKYPWTRFWHPREQQPSISDNGFLRDRDQGSIWRDPNSMLATLEEVRSEPCLVLLGEPGMGKSTELQLEFEKICNHTQQEGAGALFVQLRDVDSSEALARRLTQKEEFRKWATGTHVLSLFVDSLDEGLLGAPTLASNLAEVFAGLSVERLRLRLTSRIADWPSLLTDALSKTWGKDNIRYLQLAPLRETDVSAAARAESVTDVGEFLSQVSARNVGALAARPVTLRLLLNTFQRNGTLPNSRRGLFDEGCRLLATELSQSRLASRRVGMLDARQRIALAGRIAFVLVFSNRSAIWTGIDYGDVPASDVTVDDLIGGVETAGGVRVTVGEAEIREVLDTGLFSARAESEMGFSHQTYMEHLAAWYVAQHRMEWPQIASLLIHPGDRDRRVVPQLRETAARLAEHGSRILEKIVARDPDVVLAADLSTASPQHRSALVSALLERVRREGVSLSVGRSQPELSMLSHSSLETQLEAVIGNSADHVEARCLALEIASACSVTALSPLMATVALDNMQPFAVRLDAAYAIARMGDTTSRELLKSLALNPPADDNYDQLRGCALRAAWPQNMTAEELFDALKSPKRSDHLGPYEIFLQTFASHLRREHVVSALEWARPYAVLDGRMGSAVSGVMWRAWDDLDTPGVVERFAAIAYERLERHLPLMNEDEQRTQEGKGSGRFDDELASSESRRRSLILAIFPLLKAPGDVVMLLYHSQTIVLTTDAEWAIAQLRSSESDATKRAWAELLWRLFLRSAWDPSLYEQIYAASDEQSGDPVLRERFADILQPIVLDSPRAEELRAKARESAQWDLREKRERKAYPATVAQVQSMLTDFESGDTDAWWHLSWYIGRNEEGTQYEHHYLDITDRPIWRALDETARARTVDAAFRYVVERTSQPEEWRGKNVTYWPAVAGYRALLLLQKDSPEQLDSLSAQVWRAWAPILVAHPLYGNDDESAASQRLIARAYTQAPDEVIATLNFVIDEEDRSHQALFVLNRMEQCWGHGVMESALLGRVRDSSLSIKTTETLLRELVTRNVEGTEAFATSLIRVPVAESGEDRERLMMAAGVLLSTGSRAGHETVWPAMKANREFGNELLLSIAGTRESLIPGIVERWGESAVGDVYLWLEEVFPWKEDPQPQGVFTPSPRYNVGHWRRDLRFALEQRGTPESVATLERINDALPVPWHAAALRNAKEATRRQTWTPPSPAQLLQLLRAKEARLVRDGRELTKVVLESLRRFQDELQGESPLARMLWYQSDGGKWRPRDEGDLADAIERHLRHDLRDSGIVAGREIVIRRGAGAQVKGQRTDIYVYAVTPGELEDDFSTASLIIEVKCSWNRDVLTAMESQLVGEYLKQNQRTPHGLYVVGWYFSRAWDRRDRRSRSADPIKKLPALRATLSQQARESSRSSGRNIGSVALDVSLGSN